MMNNKRKLEPTVLEYKDHRSSSTYRRASAGEQREEYGMSNRQRNEAQGRYKRNVSTPEEIQRPATWAERNARYVRPATRRTAPRQVQRTLARTGMAAPEGPVRVVKALPRAHTPIPARSGEQRRRRTFWRRFLTLFALIALAVAATSFALFSPNFHVGQVTVEGTSNPALVHSIQHMGMQGQNIFLIDIPDFT